MFQNPFKLRMSESRKDETDWCAKMFVFFFVAERYEHKSVRRNRRWTEIKKPVTKIFQNAFDVNSEWIILLILINSLIRG